MSDDKRLALKVGGKSFDNPVFLASGPAGYGLEYAGFLELGILGAIVTKTVSWEPRSGNPGIRLHETPSGLLNSVGLENVGGPRFFSEKLPALLDSGIRV
ncbi:MAG TPA: hypothetical protein VLA34_01080, partial [Candidatus Krumholzibacterium sp.]|nr:hypothetical protein [Candidatus Krumholzibacterium sp.]